MWADRMTDSCTKTPCYHPDYHHSCCYHHKFYLDYHENQNNHNCHHHLMVQLSSENATMWVDGMTDSEARCTKTPCYHPDYHHSCRCHHFDYHDYHHSCHCYYHDYSDVMIIMIIMIIIIIIKNVLVIIMIIIKISEVCCNKQLHTILLTSLKR